LLLLALPLQAQFTLYTAMVTSKGYVVGAKLPPSGIFFKRSGGVWQHAGYNHPALAALDYDGAGPAALYLAAGNGAIRAPAAGEQWKILTGNDVTELRDIAIDRLAPGTIYFTHTAGIRVSRDAGVTWHAADQGIRRKFTESIAVDRTRSGHLVAGTEDGIFESADGGAAWRLAGASGFEVRRVQQSPHDPCRWLAVTQRGGVFLSTDCGETFETTGRVGIDRNLYDVAFDPTTPGRMAVAGWGIGVAVTEDDGKSWRPRNAELPRPDVWSVAFDPAHAGRLYAGVHEEALFVSDDAGLHWRSDGLEGSIVRRMVFIPEPKQ
jgi:hypothetical protein